MAGAVQVHEPDLDGEDCWDHGHRSDRGISGAALWGRALWHRRLQQTSEDSSTKEHLKYSDERTKSVASKVLTDFHQLGGL